MKKEDLPEDPRVSKEVRKILRQKGYHVQYNKDPKHYTQSARFNIGYNKLQYLGIVRHYLQKRFKISYRELEMLLFLYPKLLFDNREFKEYPKSFTNRDIREPIKRGYIEVFTVKHEYHKVYQLTRRAKVIVTLFYKYISGELPIPEDPQTNPMFKKDANPMDKKRAEMIKKMNSILLENPPADPNDYSV